MSVLTPLAPEARLAPVRRPLALPASPEAYAPKPLLTAALPLGERDAEDAPAAVGARLLALAVVAVAASLLPAGFGLLLGLLPAIAAASLGLLVFVTTTDVREQNRAGAAAALGLICLIGFCIGLGTSW